jgi:uroporphyrinogen-III synthase
MQESLLSTKLLTESQQELVLNANVGVTHYDVLKTKTIPAAAASSFKNVIITSKNAIPYLIGYNKRIENLYCVGSTTAALLAENLIPVHHVEQNAAALSRYLIKNHSKEHFTYPCSRQRRDELPALFQEAQIPLEEVFVYDSIAVMKSFDRIFAAVTFYSPRGVHAFAKANPKNRPLTAICIGETTASTARSYFEKVIVANKQTVENTLITAIKALRND